MPFLSGGDETVIVGSEQLVATRTGFNVGSADGGTRGVTDSATDFLVTDFVPLFSRYHHCLLIPADRLATTGTGLLVSGVDLVVLQLLLCLCRLEANSVPLLSAGDNGVLASRNLSDASRTSLRISLVHTVVSEVLRVLSGIEARAMPGASTCYGLFRIFLDGVAAVRAFLEVLLVDLVRHFLRWLDFKTRSVPFLSSGDDTVLGSEDFLVAAGTGLGIASLDVVGFHCLRCLELRHRLRTMRMPLFRSHLGGVGRAEGFGAIGTDAHVASATRSDGFGGHGRSAASTEFRVRRQPTAALATLAPC